MATYREIHGKAIKSLSTDPSDAAVAGQIWYNTSSDTFKTVVTVSGFSSGAPINQARGYLGGITGTGATTAGLIFGGNTSGPTSPGNDSTEEYNGSGWSVGGNLGTGRLSISGFGIQTAAVGMGGRTPASAEINTTEEYDGSAWTAGGALSTARRYLSGAGTLTSGLAFAGTVGGAPGAGTPQTVTEEYNGTAWTAGGALGTARQRGAGTGASQTAAICFGGNVPPVTGNTEEYNGASWSEGNNMNTGKASVMGWGLSTLAVATGGESATASYTTTTEDWNGTSWSTNPSTLPTGNQAMAGQGAATAGLLAGGWKPAPVGNTSLEYNSSINVITAAAWSAGGVLPVMSTGGAGMGTQTAAVYVGGLQYTPGGSPTPTNKRGTYNYDGTSWTAQSNINYDFFIGSSAGTQTAGLAFGGMPGGSGALNSSSEYDGSSWTSSPDTLGTAVQYAAGVGIQTAALCIGGRGDPPPSGITTVEEYDGTNWTTSTAQPTANYNQSAGGVKAACWVAGGPGDTDGTFELSSGTWTASGNLNTARPEAGQGGYGPQTAGITAGGAPPGLMSEQYDGTVWSTGPNLAVSRNSGMASTIAASSKVGAVMAGSPPHKVETEEYNEETTAVNVKTLTQS